MGDRIGAGLRRQIARRAGQRCEYCLIREEDTFFGCEVDHVVSRKHGGTTTLDNLAYACFFCNRKKGSDIGSVIPSTGLFVRLFNPRIDVWMAHFAIDSERLKPLSEIGEATARLLDFNGTDRVLERRSLLVAGRYPG